jgi:Holliday junction resolvasome RuvABC endonuclease subunit
MLIKDVEKKLGKTLKRNHKVLGLDTASKTGWCLLTTTKKELTVEYGFIKVNTTDKYFKYNEIIKFFQELIQPDYQVVIEDTFFRFNPAMFRLISRIGAIAYTLAHLKGCKAEYIFATTARSRIGLKGNAKKAIIQEEFKKMLGLEELKDEDIIDSYILAYNGLFENLVEEN